MDDSLTLPCDVGRLASVITGICFAFDRDLDVHILLADWAGRERELLIRLWNCYVLAEKPLDVDSDPIASTCETTIDLKRRFDCSAIEKDSRKPDLSISALPGEGFFQESLEADLSISSMRGAVFDFADELDMSLHEDTVEAVLGAVIAKCTASDSTSMEIDTSSIDAIVSDAMHKLAKIVSESPPVAQKNPSSSSLVSGDRHACIGRSSSFSIVDEETADADGLLNRIDLEEAYDIDWFGSSQP